MMNQAEPGTYVLVIALSEPVRLEVGGLGAHDFRAGYYLYVGSALNGLRNRVARHIRKEKRLHWHIDYLLQVATVVDVWRHMGPERLECAWAEALERSGQVERVVKDFGASDCRCGGHLFYSAARPSPLRPDASQVKASPTDSMGEGRIESV